MEGHFFPRNQPWDKAKLLKFCFNGVSHHRPCLGTLPISRLIFLFLLKGKRLNLKQHEHSALRDHMLLVLEKNFQLEEQVNE